MYLSVYISEMSQEKIPDFLRVTSYISVCLKLTLPSELRWKDHAHEVFQTNLIQNKLPLFWTGGFVGEEAGNKHFVHTHPSPKYQGNVGFCQRWPEWCYALSNPGTFSLPTRNWLFRTGHMSLKFLLPLSKSLPSWGRNPVWKLVWCG